MESANIIPGIKRYAICGLSIRGIHHFLLPLLGKKGDEINDDFSAHSEIVGIFDTDTERCRQFLAQYQLEIPCFTPAQGVDAMIRETRPDVLLVTGPDYTHCEHILAGLRHGLRVIAEKPMVVNGQQAQEVLRAERDGKGQLCVSHNVRYGNTARQVKEMLLAGKVGRITNIEFVYNLDTMHGASYFTRWNRERAKSGGLSIHKSVHHLDLINWLIGSAPETVFSFGALNYYGPKGAHRPLGPQGEPLSLAETKAQCPYFQKNYASKGILPSDVIYPGWDTIKLSYPDQYPEDRYIYDDTVDIEDTYSSVIRYQNGAMLSYSVNFSTPWEGFTLAINGTAGRLEISSHSTPDPAGGTPLPAHADTIRFLPLFGGLEEHVVEKASGGHGGADPIMRRDLFLEPGKDSVRLGLSATAYEAAVAVATGEAIWRSSVEGRPITLQELLGEFYQF